jgi:iron uptake system component EfeO
VAAVTQNDLVPYVLKYEAYVTARLPQLRTQVAALRGAIDAGDLAAARTAWLPAHLTYEQLGAAYGAFGDADNEINGTADGLPHGVQDSGFTGFHRIEYGLWHGESAASLTAPANGLLAAVTALGPQFARAQIDPLEVSIRAHEITENALEFELTGRTDYGSHSNLATIDANLAGTREVLTVLQPLLAPRYPALPRATAELAQTEAQLAATEHAGDYPPLSSLSQPQRERLDSDLSELTELLAPVAAILEPRRTTS